MLMMISAEIFIVSYFSSVCLFVHILCNITKLSFKVESPGIKVTAGKGNSLTFCVSMVVLTYLASNLSTVSNKKYETTTAAAVTITDQMILVLLR